MKSFLGIVLCSVALLGVPFALAAEGGVGGTVVPGVWQKLSWTTSDGVKLVGLYHPAARRGAYTWVFLHGLGSAKEEWKAFSEKLAGQGNGILLYDARGHGESVQSTAGGPVSYKAWQTAGPGTPWAAMPGDLATTVHWLKTTHGVPENKIAVGGASLGANVALVYASEHPQVPALLLLSSGLEYAGISIPEAWTRYAPRKVMLAASPDDRYAYGTLQELCKNSPYSDCPKMDGRGAEHGVNMFKDDEFSLKLLRWMKGLDGNRDRRPS